MYLFGVWIFFFNNMIIWPDSHVFFQSLIHLPQTKQKPWMLLGFFYNQLLFSLGTVFMFISEVIYSIPYPYH